MKMDKCEGKTDEELVELTLKDQDFLFCLTKRYETKLFSYILRISNVSKEEAEDILQEVFIKVYYNLNSFDKELKFSSWIYRITHNQVISNFRKIKARAETVTFDLKDEIIKNIASEFDIKEELDYKIFREKIERLLNNINKKYKEVLVLYLLEEKIKPGNFRHIKEKNWYNIFIDQPRQKIIKKRIMNKKIKQIGEKALQIIKQKKISPKSKWQCLLYSRIAWGLSLVFVVIGSLAFSVVIYMEKNNDWDMYSHLGDSLPLFIIVTLPYFWIGLLILLVYLAFFSSRFTKEGYRYKLVTLLSVGLLASMALGIIFHSIGFGRNIDTYLEDKVSAYHYVSVNKAKMWTQPEKGLLAGLIISVNKDQLTIADYEDKEWNIELDENVIVKGRMKIDVGMKIRIVGEKLENNNFLAKRIGPLIGRGLRSHRGMQGY